MICCLEYSSVPDLFERAASAVLSCDSVSIRFGSNLLEIVHIYTLATAAER